MGVMRTAKKEKVALHPSVRNIQFQGELPQLVGTPSQGALSGGGVGSSSMTAMNRTINFFSNAKASGVGGVKPGGGGGGGTPKLESLKRSGDPPPALGRRRRGNSNASRGTSSRTTFSSNAPSPTTAGGTTPSAMRRRTGRSQSAATAPSPTINSNSSEDDANRGGASNSSGAVELPDVHSVLSPRHTQLTLGEVFPAGVDRQGHAIVLPGAHAHDGWCMTAEDVFHKAHACGDDPSVSVVDATAWQDVYTTLLDALADWDEYCKLRQHVQDAKTLNGKAGAAGPYQHQHAVAAAGKEPTPQQKKHNKIEAVRFDHEIRRFKERQQRRRRAGTQGADGAPTFVPSDDATEIELEELQRWRLRRSAWGSHSQGHTPVQTPSARTLKPPAEPSPTKNEDPHVQMWGLAHVASGASTPQCPAAGVKSGMHSGLFTEDIQSLLNSGSSFETAGSPITAHMSVATPCSLPPLPHSPWVGSPPETFARDSSTPSLGGMGGLTETGSPQAVDGPALGGRMGVGAGAGALPHPAGGEFGMVHGNGHARDLRRASFGSVGGVSIHRTDTMGSMASSAMSANRHRGPVIPTESYFIDKQDTASVRSGSSSSSSSSSSTACSTSDGDDACSKASRRTAPQPEAAAVAGLTTIPYAEVCPAASVSGAAPGPPRPSSFIRHLSSAHAPASSSRRSSWATDVGMGVPARSSRRGSSAQVPPTVTGTPGSSFSGIVRVGAGGAPITIALTVSAGGASGTATPLDVLPTPRDSTAGGGGDEWSFCDHSLLNASVLAALTEEPRDVHSNASGTAASPSNASQLRRASTISVQQGRRPSLPTAQAAAAALGIRAGQFRTGRVVERRKMGDVAPVPLDVPSASASLLDFPPVVFRTRAAGSGTAFSLMQSESGVLMGSPVVGVQQSSELAAHLKVATPDAAAAVLNWIAETSPTANALLSRVASMSPCAAEILSQAYNGVVAADGGDDDAPHPPPTPPPTPPKHAVGPAPRRKTPPFLAAAAVHPQNLKLLSARTISSVASAQSESGYGREEDSALHATTIDEGDPGLSSTHGSTTAGGTDLDTTVPLGGAGAPNDSRGHAAPAAATQRMQLGIDLNCLLGFGAHGRVYKGILHEPPAAAAASATREDAPSPPCVRDGVFGPLRGTSPPPSPPRLDGGGFGTLFPPHDTMPLVNGGDAGAGRVVAVKKMFVERRNRKVLQRELAIWQRLSLAAPTYIVRYYGSVYNKTAREFNVAMEYCRYGSLQDLMNRLQRRGGGGDAGGHAASVHSTSTRGFERGASCGSGVGGGAAHPANTTIFDEDTGRILPDRLVELYSQTATSCGTSEADFWSLSSPTSSFRSRRGGSSRPTSARGEQGQAHAHAHPGTGSTYITGSAATTSTGCSPLVATHTSPTRTTRFPDATIRRMTRHVLEGLAFLHAGGVIHRDVKTSNLLLSSSGFIKLCDFGVSTCLGSKSSVRQTCVGTPGYLAPEVIQEEPYSTPIDIWSLGCTVMEMATGRRPYTGMNPAAVLYRTVNDARPPICPSLPEEMQHFLSVCLVKEPGARRTATQLLEGGFSFDRAESIFA